MPAKKKTSAVKEVKPVAAKPVKKVSAPVKAAAPAPVKAVASTPVKAPPPAAPAATPAPAKKVAARPVKPILPAPAVESTGKTPAGSTTTVSAEERYQMIQQAAYFLAERQGFQGDSSGHWIEAERQINEQLGIR